MHPFKKLAIAGAVSALMMTTTAAHAVVSAPTGVSYNQNTSAANNNYTGPWSNGAPAGYSGKLPATWLVNTDNNSTYTISTAGALAAGAPVIESTANRWNPSRSWGNALDFGMIDLSAPGTVSFTVQADASQSSTFTPGFTVFSGWANNGTGNRHGAWNATPSNPGTLTATGLNYLGNASTTTAGGTATLTLPNLAAGHYSIWIGGNGPTGSPIGSQRYTATIAAVPEPEEWAMMMFGLPFMGWVARHKQAKDKTVAA